MAKIEYVKAWGLWSHLETVLNFSPGLTVITGPNGNGKSTLIRIIRWVALGEPAGEEFIFKLTDETTGEIVKQAEEGKAEIGLDNGVVITKTRRKGKTTYTINTIAEPFEKAEVPQEVKDALNLRKYSFGDFDTYLNFAFQMEAPFLLSEAPSTGAKVLGKLAGTETVDLAIAEVSKRTHKARDEKRTADKEIERLNGDLLEYQDIEDIKVAIDACTYLVGEADAAASRKDFLTSLVNTLDVAKERIEILQVELVTLAVVPSLDEDLQHIEQSQLQYNKLLSYLSLLEEAAQSIFLLTAQLVAYNGLEVTAAALTRTEADGRRLTSISELSTNYQHYTQVVEICQVVLRTLTSIDVAAADLAIYDKQAAKAENLRLLQGEYITHSRGITTLAAALSGMEQLAEADKLLTVATVTAERLDKITTLKNEYTSRDTVVRMIAESTVVATLQLGTAQKELDDAWLATGGICPLCEQGLTEHLH